MLEQIYDNMHLALWSLLIATLIFFGIFVAPNILAARRNYEENRALEIAAEQEFYCRKLGMIPGSANHHACMLHLQDYRTRIERRLLEESNF